MAHLENNNLGCPLPDIGVISEPINKEQLILTGDKVLYLRA